jgi:transcriptional regulator with XRE-family HTH domain
MKPARVRKILGLSQSQLAAILGVHHMTVSKWERETLDVPPYYAALLKAFALAAERKPEVGEGFSAFALANHGAVYALYILLEAAYSPQ